MSDTQPPKNARLSHETPVIKISAWAGDQTAALPDPSSLHVGAQIEFQKKDTSPGIVKIFGADRPYFLRLPWERVRFVVDAKYDAEGEEARRFWKLVAVAAEIAKR